MLHSWHVASLAGDLLFELVCLYFFVRFLASAWSAWR
jgi:hypothetical protein